MDAIITRPGGVYSYDSYRDQHDTNLINDLSGSSSISSNKLLISNADVVTFAAVNNSQVELLLQIPVAPVAAQSKVFGLKSPAGGDRGAIVFDITGAVFTAKVYNAAGTTTLFSQEITWSSAWTDTLTRFRISATERNVLFIIEDTIVAHFERKFGTDAQAGVLVNTFTRNALPVRITNGNADNLFLSTINIF